MIPLGHETVTLIQRVETVRDGRTSVTYNRIILTECSWRRTTRTIRNDNAMFTEESITCRVPTNQTKPKSGDLMILGSANITVNSSADYQRLIEQYRGSDGAFVISSVRDNARPGMPMPHYAARG